MPNELHESDRPAPAGEAETTTPRDRDETGSNRPGDRAAGDTGIEIERVDERLRAVERALTGSESPVVDVTDDAAAAAERADLESRLDEVETRVEELEAATQALRGYAGSIRAVNREVERRADLALARASGGGCGDVGDGSDRDRRDDRDAAETVGVPSDDAIDAAVPDERGGALDDGERAGSTDDSSWRDGPLDRLRESL